MEKPFQKIIYGSNYYFWHILDLFLLFFKNADHISNDIIINPRHDIPDYNNVISYLSDNKFIEIHRDEISITLKGKMIINAGGFKKKAIVGRIYTFSLILCIIASILAIVAFFSGTLHL